MGELSCYIFLLVVRGLGVVAGMMGLCFLGFDRGARDEINELIYASNKVIAYKYFYEVIEG